MKRVFQKAIAFISAVAVAASMAISASAESAGKRIVANAGYKQVIATDSGVFFTNFSDEEIQAGSASKTVLCVTPDGKKTKVKVKNSKLVTSCRAITTYSAFLDFNYEEFLNIEYLNRETYSTSHQLIFSNGKTVNVSETQDYKVVQDNYLGKYALVTDSITRDNSGRKQYGSSTYKLYDYNGKLVFSTPYSALKGADGDYVSLVAYDSKTKSALFVGMYNPDIQKNPIWLVRNKKTIATFSGSEYGVAFVKSPNGQTAIRIYENTDTFDKLYYSVDKGKKISKFQEYIDDTVTQKYSVKDTGTKYNVLNKSGKVIYSINKKKAAGYHVYEKSVAIITKSGSKYGLILVK